MSKHRNWTVYGFDIDTDKTKNLNVHMKTLSSFQEVVVSTPVKAAETLIRHPIIGKMLPDNANLVHYYGNVNLNASDYNDIRSIRKHLITTLKLWAEKSRLVGSRGFRSFALKDVVIEKSEHMKDVYVLKFDVIFSNCSFYDTAKNQSQIHSQEEIGTIIGHETVLYNMMKNITSRTLSVSLKPIK